MPSKPVPFGKYLLLDRIARGGFGEVFKAKAFGVDGFERAVAVKRILPSIAADPEILTMFIDEAKIAVQLTHTNIAQIFDLGRVGDDGFFIAMEYVHGKDLRAIFDRARKRGETVPLPMACYVIMKVCEALDYAHNKKDAAGRDLEIVHRDVSPQNVLTSYEGEVKVIDFGLARAQGKAAKTQAGILAGKLGYMSPEQVRGMPLDRRSDLFAVGILLYELVTCERLFVGESEFSTLEKIRNVELVPPSDYNRRVPEELEDIVLKALAKDVEDRYQTAMDLHDDLQSFMMTSGNFFSRKDLATYQRQAFAEDIARESAREAEYEKMEAAEQVHSRAEGGKRGPAQPTASEPESVTDNFVRMPPPGPQAAAASSSQTGARAGGAAPPAPGRRPSTMPPPGVAVRHAVRSPAAASEPPPGDVSISRLVGDRIGHESQFSNYRAFVAAKEAGRMREEAHRAAERPGASERRVQSARSYLDAVERALQERLASAFTSELRGEWARYRAAVLTKKAKPSEERQLQEFLERGSLPSLTVLAIWHHRGVEPPELTDAIRAAVGLTRLQSRQLWVLGALRNVLAHRNEYELRVDQPLDQAQDFLTVHLDANGTRRRLDVEDDELGDLEALTRWLLHRRREH